MSDDIEDILNEIQLDPKYQLDGPGDFDEFDDDDLNNLMNHLGQQQQQHDEENDRHHHKASHHQKGNSSHHHNPKSAAPRSSTQANLDELESLVAELASGDDDDHHHGHHQGHHHHHGGNGGGHHGHHGGSGGGHHHTQVESGNFESSLDALLVDLGGIGERDSIPPSAPKRNTPQGHHHHHTQVESGNFEDLLSDLTGGTPPSSGVRMKANSNAPEPVKPTPLAATSSNNKKQPINPRDSAAYVDDLENLMGELIGTSGGRSNSIVDRNPPAVAQNRSQGGLQRGPSRSGQLSTHQESDDGDLDSLISELSSTPQQPASRSANTVSKTYTGNAPKSQPQQQHHQQQHQQHQTSAPASRQPTQQAQPSRKPQTILEGDDFDSLMADLAPTAANKGRQSAMVPQNNKMSTNLNSSEVSELDNLMANLYPPNIHGKKPGGGNPQQKNNNQRVSVQADVNTDLDDMINNLQTGYGMVEQPSTAPQNNRNQKGGSTYISYNNPGEYNSNYNNNPQAAYNPNSSANRNNNNNNNNYNQSNFNNQQPSYNQSNNNSHQGGGGFNQNSNAAASRTNTNQGNNNHNKQSRAAPASKDLMMMMDDLTTVDNYSMPPMNQHHQQHQQQPARKPEQPKLGKGMCAGCRKYIASTQKIQAMGREYHTDHFTCSTCEKVIGNANFFEKEGQPQCEACYQSHFCNRCANCGQPITSHCVSALNQSWHPDCWVCTKCRTPFNNASFYVKNNKAYCAVCSEDLNSQRCRGCNQPIRGTMINALGTTWHMDHFVCQSCHHPFPGGVFYEINGLPYCEQHYQSIR